MTETLRAGDLATFHGVNGNRVAVRIESVSADSPNPSTAVRVGLVVTATRNPVYGRGERMEVHAVNVTNRRNRYTRWARSFVTSEHPHDVGDYSDVQ